jgi:hypothetical protein
MLGVALLVLSTYAYAQTAEAAVEPSWLSQIWTNYVIPLAGTALAAFLGWIFNILRQKLNIDIEARNREAFQTALQNGAGILLKYFGDKVFGTKITLATPHVAEAVNYVRSGAKDAIASFGGMTDEQIVTRLDAKVGAMVAPVAAEEVVKVKATEPAPPTT